MTTNRGGLAENLARISAYAGGIALVVLALMTVVSIAGRALIPLGLKPVPGDFELVEAGTAFAVCAFLPWCQIARGHATVAVFTDSLGHRFNRLADLVTDLLFLLTSIALTWRHIAGLLDKKSFGETTFILQFPLWWAYAACLFGLAIWVVVATHCVWQSLVTLLGGAPPASDRGTAS